MYCPSFPEAPTMQTLIVCVPERPGHSVSSDSPLDAAIDEGLRGLGAGSDSMRTTPRSGTFREHSPRRALLYRRAVAEPASTSTRLASGESWSARIASPKSQLVHRWFL